MIKKFFSKYSTKFLGEFNSNNPLQNMHLIREY